ncbi:MAG: hypothetical protein P8186_03315 [Anaerolineae bacterium]
MVMTPSGKREVFPDNGLRYQRADTLPVYRFDQFSAEPSLVHAAFTRQGGVSLPPYASLNLGHTVSKSHDQVHPQIGGNQCVPAPHYTPPVGSRHHQKTACQFCCMTRYKGQLAWRTLVGAAQ